MISIKKTSRNRYTCSKGVEWKLSLGRPDHYWSGKLIGQAELRSYGYHSTVYGRSFFYFKFEKVQRPNKARNDFVDFWQLEGKPALYKSRVKAIEELFPLALQKALERQQQKMQEMIQRSYAREQGEQTQAWKRALANWFEEKPNLWQVAWRHLDLHSMLHLREVLFPKEKPND